MSFVRSDTESGRNVRIKRGIHRVIQVASGVSSVHELTLKFSRQEKGRFVTDDLASDLWQRIDAYLGEDVSILAAGAAPRTELDKIEQCAAFDLPEDYREFVLRYGGAIVGSYEIAGFGQSEAMSNASPISLTERFRSDNWPGVLFGLVISMDGSGNPICIMRDGAIVSFDHNVGEFFLFGNTFRDFVLNCCLGGHRSDVIENYQIPWPNDWTAS